MGVEDGHELTIYGCMAKPDTESYETDLKCEEKTERTGICLGVSANVRRTRLNLHVEVIELCALVIRA